MGSAEGIQSSNEKTIGLHGSSWSVRHEAEDLVEYGVCMGSAPPVIQALVDQIPRWRKTVPHETLSEAFPRRP